VGPVYQVAKSQLAQIGALAAFNPRWGLRLRYTEGVSAPKATLRPTWRVGVIATQPLAARRSLTTEFYTSIGGHLVHRPCLDAYDRRGTGQESLGVAGPLGLPTSAQRSQFPRASSARHAGGSRARSSSVRADSCPCHNRPSPIAPRPIRLSTKGSIMLSGNSVKAR
jgi:hypothetical protein